MNKRHFQMVVVFLSLVTSTYYLSVYMQEEEGSKISDRRPAEKSREVIKEIVRKGRAEAKVMDQYLHPKDQPRDLSKTWTKVKTPGGRLYQATVRSGTPVNIDGTSYIVSNQFRAVHKSLWDGKGELGRVGQYVIVRGKGGTTLAGDSAPLIFNSNKYQAGVLTGVIVAKVKPESNLQELIQSENLTVQDGVTHLDLVMFRAPAGADIPELNRRLHESGLFNQVSPEILSGGPFEK